MSWASWRSGSGTATWADDDTAAATISRAKIFRGIRIKLTRRLLRAASYAIPLEYGYVEQGFARSGCGTGAGRSGGKRAGAAGALHGSGRGSAVCGDGEVRLR